VAINCAAIVGDLFEAELFGHVKGAFTGAVQTRKGRFEEANGGTLFLDEVGLLPMDLQCKFLRVLEDKVIYPVGRGDPVPVNVRIIAATNLDLERSVKKGLFREDLYYRIFVFPIRLPPLRDRREDIPLIADHLLDQQAHKRGMAKPTLSVAALGQLMDHDWPGNVRELANVLERNFVTSNGQALETLDLPSRARPSADLAGSSVGTYADFLARMERTERGYWERVHRLAGGRVADILELAGTSYQTVRRKMHKFGLKTIEGEPDPSEPDQTVDAVEPSSKAS
jgi:two-component system response regulator HydG